MKKHLLYYVPLLLIFFSTACKKEKKDATSPSISISNPASGQAFNMFDTLLVTAHVSDETRLSSVVVALVDINNIVLQYSYNVPIQSNDFTFNIHYILNEYHLESGTYYISVTAGDGANHTQRVQQISVTESPTTRSGYFIVGATQPKTIVKYNNTLAQQNSISLNTGYNGMAFGPYYQQLYINGNVNQAFIGYDVGMGLNTWSYPYNGGGSPTFECVATDGKKAFIGYFSGYVTSVTNAGAPSTSYFNGNNNYYPYYFTLTSSYGIGFYHDILGGSDKVASFLRNTGTSINSTFMPIKVLALFEHTQDELYVLGNNSSGQAVYYFFNVTTNSLQGPYTLPTGKLLSAAQADSDHLLLAMDNSNIYGFQYSTGNASVLASIKAQKIVYNAKMRELNAASKNSMYTYSLSTNYALTQTSLASVTDSIIGFEVITNK